jgi:TM2 domain-containing membrane protein YozV
MKKITLGSLMGLAIASVFSSCTMEKRVYSSGYHIEWNHSKKDTESSKTSFAVNDKAEKKDIENASQEQNEKLDEVLSAVTSNQVLDKKEDNGLLASTEKSKVISTPSKSKFNSIRKASNGENFSNNFVKGVVLDDNKVVVAKKENYKNKKHISESKAALGGGKSQLVALLLCFFLGFLGIHRFYLGYTGLGIMYLLFALVGIPLAAILIGLPLVAALAVLIIIDFIRIIIGSLKPKGGSYSKTF